MESIGNAEKVREQYKTAANLQTRISLHTKYSVNRQGFTNWIYEQYRLNEHDCILELGCGDGSMWKTHGLPTGASLILTDFSEGMLASAKANVPENMQITFRQADIQSIPYEDDAFDAVIANMMLYHVPDLHRGLSEVRRVLRPGGWFYCATYGQNGILAYVQDLFAAHGNGEVGNDGFTLQNGAEHLGRYFSVVEKRLYDDRLEVKDTQDLVDYILSMNGIADLASVSAEEFYRVLDARKKDGVITIPKEYGMFLAQK